jgi:hypothetical protein
MSKLSLSTSLPAIVAACTGQDHRAGSVALAVYSLPRACAGEPSLLLYAVCKHTVQLHE